jgi:hypothetical protein
MLRRPRGDTPSSVGVSPERVFDKKHNAVQSSVDSQKILLAFPKPPNIIWASI